MRMLGQRISLIASVAIAALLSLSPFSNFAHADSKPVLIVSVSSVDGLLADIGYLARVTGNEQYGHMAGAIAQGYIQGLDHSRPIAIVIQSDGNEVKPLGMLPVKDLKQFLAGLAQQLGEPQDAGDGIFELAGPAPMFVKEQNGWAYIGQSAIELKNLPADPTAMLDGLDKKYDVGIRAYIQNVPQHMRDMALEQIKEGVKAQMDSMPKEDDEDAELQRTLVQNQVRQWESIFNEMNYLQFGWNTDENNQRLVMDTRVVAIPGTRTARQMSGIQDTKTSYGGFYNDDAAIGVRSVGRIQQEDIDQALGMMPSLKAKLTKEIDGSDELPNDQTKQVAKRLATSMFEMLEATLREGVTDGAFSVTFESGSPQVVAGMHVVDGGKMEESLKELSQMNAGDATMPKMEFNVDQHAGVRFHRVTLPVDAEEPKARAVFGDSIELTVGVSQTSMYFAMGDDGVSLVRKSMDASQPDQTVKPAEMYAALSPILNFASKVSDEDMVDVMAEELASVGTQDRVVMTVQPIDNGADYHFEIREAILKAIGAGIKAKQMEAAGAGG